jgi:hypothetical protein
MVVAISEFDEGGPQFLEIAESAEPKDLFFEGAKEALDACTRAFLGGPKSTAGETRDGSLPRKRLLYPPSALAPPYHAASFVQAALGGAQRGTR